MEQTMKKYAEKIEHGDINPHIRYDGKKSGLILDPKDENVPLSILGFGIYQLEDGPFFMETHNREVVLIPQNGFFEIKTRGIIFSGERTGGPFASISVKSNACAIYIPRDSEFEISGTGEVIYYTAPSSKSRKPVYIKVEDVKNLSRGSAFWRRDVITLITNDISTNLIVGETYSPPCFWSGTPPHIHDKDDPDNGQSDHEEVYYHIARLEKGNGIGSYAIQMLFDGKVLNKAYIIGNKSIIAIPGGIHTVVAGPVSDIIYGWALAGKESSLKMWDIPEFSYLKKIERIVNTLEQERGRTKVLNAKIENMISSNGGLIPHERKMLELILFERGFDIT